MSDAWRNKEMARVIVREEANSGWRGAREHRPGPSARDPGGCVRRTPRLAGRGRPVDVDGDSRPAGNAADMGVCAKGRPAISLLAMQIVLKYLKNI